MNPNQNLKIESRDPADLHIHPALKDIPELADDSPEYLAMAAGVGAAGLIQPLLVDEKNRLLDDHSRTLHRIARRWALTALPVTVHQSEEVHLIILHSLCHRRHLSKSALALLAVPHLQAEFERSKARRVENVLKGQCFSKVAEATFGAKTVADLAAEMGIERNLLFEAKSVLKEFENPKLYSFVAFGGPQDGLVVEMTFKDWFLPLILKPFTGGEHEQNRPLGLGSVLKAVGYLKSHKAHGTVRPNQMLLFSESLARDASRRWRYYQEANREQREQILDMVRTQLEKLPPEEQEAVAEFYRTLASVASKLRRAHDTAAS